jgi:hypothetical protein
MDWQDSPLTNHLLMGKFVCNLEDEYRVILSDISHAS